MTEPRDSEPPGRGPYDGAMADEDEALQVAEILAHTGAVGPDGPGTAPMLSDLAVLVAAEVDRHDTARPLPGPLHRLRTDTVGLLRRAPAPYDLHDRVNRKAALALLLLHSGGPGPHRVRGAAGATARLAECLEALHLLESAHEEAREASAAEPDYRDERALRPGELLDWALWAHTEIDGVLTYALEFRPERPSAVPTPLSAPLRKLAGKLRLRRQYLFPDTGEATAADDGGLGGPAPDVVHVVTELERLMDDDTRMASGEAEHVLNRSRRVREGGRLPSALARELRLLEARIEIKWILEHRLADASARRAYLAVLKYLDGVRGHEDDLAARASVLFAEATTHAVNAGMLGRSHVGDAVEACDSALAVLSEDAPDRPVALMVRGLARAMRAQGTLADDDIAGAIEDLRQALALAPPDHSGVPNAVVTLSQLLLQRGNTTGSVADTRTSLALLNRYASDTLPSGPGVVVLRLLQALTHVVFHHRAGSEEVDCGTPVSPGVNHVDAALRQIRHTMRRPERSALPPVLSAVAAQLAAHALALASQLPGRDSAALAREALPWAEEAYVAGRADPADRQHRLLLRDWLLVVGGGDEAAEARRRLLSLAGAPAGPGGTNDPEAGFAHFLQGLLGLAAAVADDSTVAELRTAAEAAAGSPLREVRTQAALQLAAGLRRRALIHSLSARAEESERLLSAATVPAALAPLLELSRARIDRAGALRIARPDPGGPDPAADFAESRRLGLDCLRAHATAAMGQEGTADALIIARDAGALAQRVARWAAYDGAWDDVVGALETGRAVVERTRLRPDTAARLRALGEHALADAWERRSPAAAPGRPYRPHDPGRDLAVPDQLAQRVARVLDAEDTARTAGVPTVRTVAEALRAADAHALVYLLPSPAPDTPDVLERGAVLITPAGAAHWVPLPVAPGDDETLARYVAALRERTTAREGRREAAVEDWREALADLTVRMGSAFRPLLRALERHCGRRVDGRPRVVLVPVGELTFVPWAGVLLDGGTPAADRLVITTVCGARQFIGAAALPPVRPDGRTLLVNALTGEQAPWAATGVLREALYPRAVGPDGPAATARGLLKTLSEDAHRFTVVDIAAHLSADVTESWRATLRLADAGLRIDRISALDLAGTPDGGTGPRGVCVALACCSGNVSFSHPDEGFTLASAFLAARAGAVIASLWPVTNAAVGFLMTVFHHHLCAGHEPAEALRRAQRWMRDPARRAPASLPGPVARAFEERMASFEKSLGESGDSMTSPAHWAGVVHMGR
ncbi:CHAT domain-containing protein [Streptomyces sp. PG2]